LVEGAQGVGKTTLVEGVAGELIYGKPVTYVTDVARFLIGLRVGYGYKTKLEDYYAYYWKHLENWRTAQGPVVVFDRSIIDVIVYSRLLLGKGHYVERMGIELFELMKCKISAVVYLPVEFDLKPDGTREPLLSQQSEYDRELLEVMEELNITYKRIAGQIEVRRQTLIDFLHRLECSTRKIF
jgi:nicotinamide riboside kinase